jgi:cytochrome c peroxidase
MKRRPFFCVVALWLAGLAIISGRADTTSAYVWGLPRNFPRPRVPATNLMSEAKAELGRHLFYDTRLSANGTQSCATCHEQERAFTDGRAQAVGSMGEVHPRGSMSLVNIAYAAALTWGNPSLTQLEDQALVPMFGEHPIELGLQRPGAALLVRLRSEPKYHALFARAFGSESDPVSIDHLTQALATFERTSSSTTPGCTTSPAPSPILRRIPGSTKSPGSPRTWASSRRPRSATLTSRRRTCTTGAQPHWKT